MTHTAHEAGNSRDSEHDTREQILAAAQDLFLSRGYKAVAMKDIAEAVHITSAALYYHFPRGKEEVLLEMLRTIITQVSVQIGRSIEQGGAFPERLRRVVSTIRTMPFDRLPLIMRDVDTQLPESTKFAIAHQGFASLLQQITALFQQAGDAGEIATTIPAAALSQLFMGMILATMRNMPVPGPQLPVLANADEIIVTVLLHGISPHT